MIEINLLPGAGKNRSSSRRQSVDFRALLAGMSGWTKDKFLIATLVAVPLGLGATAYLYFSLGHRQAVLAEREQKAIADSTRYSRFLSDRIHATAVRDTLLREINIIKSLDGDRYVWPHIMDEVSRALPDYTWLSLLSFTGTPQGASNVVATPGVKEDTTTPQYKKRKVHVPKRFDTDIPKDPVSLRLMGSTVNIEALTRFMKDLAASPFFENVQLEKSEIASDQGKEVAQFTLTIGYRRPDTLQLHRVPMTLSPTGR